MRIETKVIRGEPIEVEGHILVPVVRQISGVERKAMIGTTTHAARGGGFVRLQPLGLAEQHADGERFIPIRDRTNQALLGLLTAAIVVPLLLSLGAWLSRRARQQQVD